MKKVINGKLYDTKTATYMVDYEWGLSNDFEYVYEALYRKKNGEFFLCGHGGPLSRYVVRSSANSYGGGQDITPLTENEAKRWVEEYCDAEDYIDIFGRPEE